MKKVTISAQKIVEATTGVEAFQSYLKKIVDTDLTMGEFSQKANKAVSCHRFQITEREWTSSVAIVYEMKKVTISAQKIVEATTGVEEIVNNPKQQEKFFNIRVKGCIESFRMNGDYWKKGEYFANVCDT